MFMLKRGRKLMSFIACLKLTRVGYNEQCVDVMLYWNRWEERRNLTSLIHSPLPTMIPGKTSSQSFLYFILAFWSICLKKDGDLSRFSFTNVWVLQILMFQFCKNFLVIGNGECFKMFNLGTPGISRVAGGSVHRARDRSLPGNKILVTPVFHLGSYIAKMFPVAAATGGHKEIFQVAITHPLGSFTVHLQIFFWVGFRWDGHYGPEMGGMDPTCCHPKPRPTNPRDFLTHHYFRTEMESSKSPRILI